MNGTTVANLSLISLLAVGGILATGYVSFPLSLVPKPIYSLPNAQVQLVLDATCYYNQCTLTQQPTASPPSFTATADVIGIVESPFVVQGYSVGVGTAAQNCGFGSGTILTPVTVIYPPTYSVLINGQKVGSVPNFFGQANVCGHVGIANFGYNYQPFWLNFTGCGTSGCGMVQFAVGYAPSMASVPLCYPGPPSAVSGTFPTWPGATSTNIVGCAQSQLAASYYSPLPLPPTTTTYTGTTTTYGPPTTVTISTISATPTTSTSQTSSTTSTTSVSTTTTSFAYSTTITVSGTTTTTTAFQTVTVLTTTQAPQAKNSQWLGIGLVGAATIVLIGFNVRKRES